MQRRYPAPSPDVFRPRRPRLVDSAALGVTRLAAKLVAIKLAGLALLLVITLHQAQLVPHRADAVLEGLLVQADSIAAALEGVSSVRPEPLIRLAPVVTGEEAGDEGGAAVRTEIADIDVVERLLAQALEGTRLRARLHGVSGDELVDSRFALRTGTDVAVAPLPPLAEDGPSVAGRAFGALSDLVARPLPGAGSTATQEPDALASALGGVKRATQRLGEDGALVLSVAVPVRDAGGAVVGALRLSTEPGMIEETVREQEGAIVRGFLLMALAAVVLSMLLAATISRPIGRLARAAESIKRGGGYVPMPELRDAGQIGELSRVLHDMTVALYSRIDSIEAFAAEVAHELKNPLTSLRSAVETLPLARNDAARDRLLEVIQHDVRRIDRLISDISDASKLDAELSRQRYDRFDLTRLLQAVADTQAELARERGQTVSLVVKPAREGFAVFGNDSRLGQVFTNLIDNALSFTPDGGTVTVTVQRFASFIEVVVDDEGPGIDEAVMERIFERFYTDRATQASFGNNSGLGLAISRQIVEAHQGEIFAENRYRTTLTPERDVAGARFTVRLPVAD